MINVILQEYEISLPELRTMPATTAHNLGLKGDYYKVQLLGDFNQIEFEYK